jgi:hypothetical protein
MYRVQICGVRVSLALFWLRAGVRRGANLLTLRIKILLFVLVRDIEFSMDSSWVIEKKIK